MSAKIKKGDRVVVPSFIVCGQCWYCQHDLYSLCDTTHPKPELQAPVIVTFHAPADSKYDYCVSGSQMTWAPRSVATPRTRASHARRTRWG